MARESDFIEREHPELKKAKNKEWEELHGRQKHKEELKSLTNWLNNDGGIDAIEKE